MGRYGAPFFEPLTKPNAAVLASPEEEAVVVRCQGTNNHA